MDYQTPQRTDALPSRAGRALAGPYRLLRADDRRLQDAVYRLRYRAYRSVDAIPPNARGRFLDDADRLPNSSSYLLLDEHGPLGAVRASLFDGTEERASLPCMAAYADVLADELGTGKVIVESSRFVTDPDLPERSLEPLTVLFKGIAANAMAHDADFVVTAVRRKHVLFYRRMMGFRRISEERTYPGINVPMTLLAADPRAEYPRAAERMVAMRMNMAEMRELAL